MTDLIEISARASVLVVEDTQSRIDWFRSRLPGAEYVDTARLAVEAASRSLPDVCFLDWNLHCFTSRAFAEYLAASKGAIVVVHSTNERGAKTLSTILPDAVFSPFGTFEIGRRT